MLQEIKRVLAVLPIVTVMAVGVVIAQDAPKVSTDDLGKFAAAFQQVQAVNQSSQNEMVKVVEENGLTVQRYNELQQAQQAPDKKVEATEEELASFGSAVENLQTIQVKVQQKMEQKITETGLSVDRYQEIAMALQSDPELQQRFQEQMQSTQ